MLKIAICDDNNVFLQLFAKNLDIELKRRNIQFQIYTYINGNLLLNHHLRDKFDVVFLDIDLPMITGFDLAKEFSEEGHPWVVFVTNHSELVYDSFAFRPLNFICKDREDIMNERMRSVINQLLEVIKQETPIILENKDMGRFSILLSDILYLESNKHFVIYHFKDSKRIIEVRDSLKNLEQKYKDNNFVRVHKKYLVNLKYVININLTKELIIFKNRFELPMSRNYKYIVDKELSDYLRRMV